MRGGRSFLPASSFVFALSISCAVQRWGQGPQIETKWADDSTRGKVGAAAARTHPRSLFAQSAGQALWVVARGSPPHVPRQALMLSQGPRGSVSWEATGRPWVKPWPWPVHRHWRAAGGCAQRSNGGTYRPRAGAALAGELRHGAHLRGALASKARDVDGAREKHRRLCLARALVGVALREEQERDRRSVISWPSFLPPISSL